MNRDHRTEISVFRTHAAHTLLTDRHTTPYRWMKHPGRCGAALSSVHEIRGVPSSGPGALQAVYLRKTSRASEPTLPNPLVAAQKKKIFAFEKYTFPPTILEMQQVDIENRKSDNVKLGRRRLRDFDVEKSPRQVDKCGTQTSQIVRT